MYILDHMPTPDLTEQRFTEMRESHIKEYGDAVLRFNAQNAQREQLSQAHEKQQLELMRSAGMKLDELEQGHLENGKKLATHLKEVREPLLARSNTRFIRDNNRTKLT